MENRARLTVACGIALMLGVMSLLVPNISAQVQQSGGPGSSVSVTNVPHVVVDTAPTTAVTGTFWQATQPVSIAALPTLAGGVNNIGIVRAVPSSCTQSTPFNNSTVGVATGAGTSVSSTTTCITLAYANNITNSAVTFRLQDKTGTPIIWVGGNGDFSIPANSNVRIPLDGVIFTSGITAIAGTGSAINLQINGLQ